MSKPMSVDECLHWIAQGAINVTEGLTEIQPGSLIHQAMEEICRHSQAGFEVAKGGKCVASNGDVCSECERPIETDTTVHHGDTYCQPCWEAR